MPASSFSESLNTGVYLFAIGLFLVLAIPILNQVYTSSEAHALHSVADGLRMEVDSLLPGMKSKFIFYSPRNALSISLIDHSILASIGSTITVVDVKWILPDVRLVPGKEYTISLSGSAVTIEENRGS